MQYLTRGVMVKITRKSEKRDDVEKEINLLGLSKKEKKDMRESVSDLLCTAEERAFKDGLHLGIDMMTGRMLSKY